MIEEIKIPEIGENVESGEVVKVLVSAGDQVQVDQTIIELETDKAVVEIPSPQSGKITEVLVKQNDEVVIGQVIARLDTDAANVEAKGSAPAKPEKAPELKREEPTPKAKTSAEPQKQKEAKSEKPVEEPKKKVEPQPQPAAQESTTRPTSSPEQTGKPAPAGPSVRRLARELGVEISEVSGSGPGGRITPYDVKSFVKRAVSGGVPSGRNLPDFSKWGEIEREPISKVRRLTAESTSFAWNLIPHVTQFDEADITEVDKFRKKYGKAVEAEGGKLTPTAILLKVMAAALREFPRFNASLDTLHEEIIYKRYRHIGIAVDTDRGLLVPVIRDVDQKSIKQLALELSDISQRARDRKIMPDEMEGGTFTISNQGSIGGVNFTPIVLWPQVAILGVSRATQRPVYVDCEFRPRLILPVSLSYDHRVIDGADAARFLSWVVDALEHPLMLQFE